MKNAELQNGIIFITAGERSVACGNEMQKTPARSGRTRVKCSAFQAVVSALYYP